MNNRTTIQIERKTRQRLMGFGHKGDTYDMILNEMMDIMDGKSRK